MLPLWNFFLNKRQFTAILIAGLVVWGVSSAVFITKESAPEVQIPIGIVTTVLPGASSEDIERLVTDKIEDRLTNLPDLDKMTSSSKSGVSVVVVQFNASANIDKSIQKLKDEVDKAKPDLPEEAKAPNVSDVNFVDQPVQMISVSADLPFVSFAKLSDDLKRELQGVEGVSRVEVSGVRHREVQVVVRKENLSRYGISLPQVVGAIASANASLPAGSITVDNISYNINFEGSLDDVKDIGNIPLFPVGGEPIYLKDIASVSDGVEKATSYSRVAVSGKTSEQAMTLSIYKVRGYDVTKMTEAVRVKLDGLKNDLLKNSSVVITFDAGKEVKKDLRELTRTGLETIILVMLCLFASIGWKEAIVAGLSIPLSFLIAFIGLLYSGNTINFVSLFSLILAIGILVDSGIVVVEAIHTRSRIMGDRTEAARQALREYAWPLIGGTMTTVAVFVPLFFISGVTGKFIATIPFTIIAVLIASIFVSLGLIPILAVVFAKDDGHSDLNDKQEAYAIKAREWYANFLHKFFANEKLQKKFLWVMAGSFVLTLFLPIIGLLKVNFFPAEDGDFVYVDIELPPGSSLSQTDLATRALEEVLYGKKYADSLVTTVGATSQFSNNAQSGERYANLIVNLVDKSDRNKTSTEIVDEIKKDIEPLKMAKFIVSQPAGGPPVGAPILLKFFGDNRDKIDEALVVAQKVLEGVPGAVNIDSSNKNDMTEFVLSVDRFKLAEMGASVSDVASNLRMSVAGVTATKIRSGNNDVDIVVSLDLNPNFTDPHEASFANIDSVKTISMRNQSGGTFLLGSVLSDSLGRNNSVINHEGRERLSTLTADVGLGYNSREVLSEFKKKMEGVEMPDGVKMKIGGENEETDKSFVEMFFALIGGVVLMFIILVLAFDSIRYSAYLLLAVPLSLIGVFFGLTIMRQTLSFPSLLGVIALSGVIINHAIILMDSIIQRFKHSDGKEFKEVVVESAVSRLRPIFLTTITTVVGMLPLTVASALWAPLAFAILFGLSFAMLLTLVLIPLLVYKYPSKIHKVR